MLIRTEAPADILTVDTLIKSSFDTESEANLVMKLRENGHRTLSLVVSNDDGEIIGYVMFSPVTLNGEDLNWQGLAPLAIQKEYRCQGLAAELVKEGLASLMEFGYPACVVLGDPNYYSRFGFEASEKHGFSCQWDVPSGVFQVLELSDNEFANRSGIIEYSSEFSEL